MDYIGYLYLTSHVGQFLFSGRMYPEFRYRAPPPSYAAAMQEYRNEMRQLESIPYVPGSPPPSYKSHTTIERPGIHIIFPRNEEFPDSNPPTYRLRSQPNRPSLAILNDVNINSCNQPVPPNRFSVSSTTALVESEQSMATDMASGIVNMSFNASDNTPDVGNHQSAELPHFYTSEFRRSGLTIDGAAQTDETVPNFSSSVAITMEACENNSTV